MASFEVVSCIAGRGFKVRCKSRKKLTHAMRGKGLYPVEHESVSRVHSIGPVLSQ